MRILAEILKQMRNIATLFISILFILLAGCKEKETSFTLKGSISDLKSDTLLVYHQVPENKLDTIITENGTFSYTFQPDTFTVFSLILDSTQTYPIYADKGEKVELSGTTGHLLVKGTGDNLVLAEILSQLGDADSTSITDKADSIIRENPYSFTSLYLIERFYVQNDFSDYGHLKELIGGLSGIIKDTPYMMNLQAKIETLMNRDKNRNIYSLQNKDKNGETIKWNSITDQYILLDFWASWEKESIAAQDSLETVLKELKKKNFLVISISLDMDKEAWLNAISERDTMQWKQLCDFTGWNNRLVKDQGIRKLPANILLNTHKQIIARDIRGQELTEKVNQMIKQDEEREKREKERKRRNKRKL